MSTNEIIKDMSSAELGARFLTQLNVPQMHLMLAFIRGYQPDAFAEALRVYGLCGLRADDDNWCILPKGHAESHDAGEFTWDTQAELDELDELHTIAAK